MRHRGYLPAKERQARSRLAKLLHQKPFLIGSLVSMPRVCGKAGCKCSRGELHPGLYLALRVGQKRKMIHVPPPLEAKVRQWVSTYQEAWRLIEEISKACYQRFFQEKQQAKGKRP
jgi:Family of unknown function (DUF6788)